MPSLFITNCLAAITLSPGNEILENAEILIENGIITGVGTKGTLPTKDAERIDAGGGIVMPGLINSHAHLPMSFFRGLCHQKPEILYNVVFPLEKHITQAEIYPLALIGLLESIRCGVTCTGDHYYYESEVFKAFEDTGARAVLGETIASQGGSISGANRLEAGIRFAMEFKDKNKLIKTCLAPHAPDTVKPEWFKEIIQLQQKENLILHFHLAQSSREVALIEELYQKSPVQHAADMGALTNKTLAAHCIHVNREDINLLKKHKTNVSHSPTSQLLFEQLAPMPDFIKAGIPVSLSTDGSCSNDDMDLLKEMRVAALAHSAQRGTPHLFSSMDLIKTVTIGGAKALGLENITGSIERGKHADIIILNSRSPRMTPCHDIANTIVFSTSTDEIKMVMVNGNILYSTDAGWTDINVADAIKAANSATVSILKRAYKADPNITNLLKSRLWKEAKR